MSQENFIVSKNSGSTVLFAKSGQTSIFQREMVSETEYRGETDATRVTDVSYSSDYAETTYYKLIDGDVYSFTAITGTKTEWSAGRQNDAGMWRAKKTETVYSVSPSPTSCGWGTTPIDQNGADTTPGATDDTIVTTFQDKQIAYQFTYNNQTLLTTTASLVREHRYLTQAAAQALVNSLTANNVNYRTVTASQYGTVNGQTLLAGTCSREIPIGTDTTASMSQQDDGYTVTETQTTYGYVTGKGWSTS